MAALHGSLDLHAEPGGGTRVSGRLAVPTGQATSA
jgi:hypothetical protein